MRLSVKLGAGVIALAVVLIGLAPTRAGAEPAAGKEAASAAELLPASTAVYVEVARPNDLLALVLDHPLRRRLEQSAEFRKALDDPKFKQFQAVVAAIESRSGVSWRKALEASAGGGLAVAFDVETQGVVLLARNQDPEAANKVRDALISLAREDAKAKGNPDPVSTQSYRGLTAYKAGDNVVGNLGPWLVVSNKPDLAKRLADTFLDGAQADKTNSLAADADFLEARADQKAAGAAQTAWAFVRMAPLRALAGANPVFDKTAKSEDAGAELIFGGLVGPLRNAPYATASLSLGKDRLKLSVAAPNDPSWVDPARQFTLAPAGAGNGGAAAPLRPKGTILSATAYRDLAGWWAAGPDLLTEGAAAKMAQADSGLSNFLGGKTFGGDVLGAVRPQINLVVAAQDFKAAGVPEPTIKLPAFAAVFRLKEKEAAAVQLRKRFRLAFNSLVTLTNLDGATKGRPMLSVTTEKRGTTEILSAGYDADMMMEGSAPAGGDAPKGKAEDGAAKAKAKAPVDDMYFNFSPAVVVSNDHVILCSSKQLAEELADLAEKEGPPDKVAKVPQNTLLEASTGPADELLRANRDQLVAKNMLEKGNDRAGAEKEVDTLIRIVDAVRGAKLSLTPTDKMMTIELEVQTQSAE